MRRRELLAASAIILTAMALPTWARGQEGYEPRSFEEALASGPAIVHVYAGWCPVCRAQKPVLATLAKDQALAGVKLPPRRTEWVGAEWSECGLILMAERFADGTGGGQGRVLHAPARACP